MELTARALLLSLVLASLAALLYPGAVAGAADEGAPRGSGFSLPLVPGPGWNSTVHHVDDDGFLHLNELAEPTTLRPHVHAPRWRHMYSVGVTVGTGHGRHTYSLVLDTASSLTWMQCVPCSEPFPQTPVSFDPAASPSFRLVSHRHHLCLPQDPHHPSRKNRCEFFATRLDGAHATSVLGNETLAFASDDAAAPEAKVHGVVIGCAHRSRGFHSFHVLAGVLGLGRQEPSLIWKLHHQGHGVDRFSYCLFPGPPSRHGFLRFGGDVPHTGEMKSTRILFMHMTQSPDFSAYFVGINGVSVGTKRLDSSVEGPFKRHKLSNGKWYGGCAIDAGTDRTKLIQPVYDLLETAVVDHVEGIGAGIPRVPRRDYPLCFRATHALFPHLPTVTMHFTEKDVRLVIQPYQLFVVVGQDLCLAVVPDPHVTVIGAMQQINTRFVYDVAAGSIYFAPEDCHADTGGQS